MKIKLVVYCVLLIRFSNVYSQEIEDGLYKSMIETMMKMWTTIDIVRAINIDLDQKTVFLKDLIGYSSEVYCLAHQIKQFSDISNAENDKEMVQSIKKSFEEVFSQVKDDGAYFVCFVLEEIINILITPENIQSEISA